jgi:molybdopterin converting factor small subunit
MSSENDIGIKIKFYSTLKNITQKDEIDLSFTDSKSVLSVLQQIQEEYFLPANSRLLNSENSKLETGIICLIDDADISICGGLKQNIKKSSIITLISSLHGG